MNNTLIELKSNSPEETLAIGRRLGECLHAGDVLGLVGQLGAGKTWLTKGIAEGLGVVDRRQVNSPTFVLVNEYDGRLKIHHLDAYRLRNPAEFEAIGLAEMLDSGTVVIVEWADRIAALLPPQTLWIFIDSTGDQERQLRLQCESSDWIERLNATTLDQ